MTIPAGRFPAAIFTLIVAALTSVLTLAGDRHLRAGQNDGPPVGNRITVPARPYHLLDAMHLFQTYSTKLYFAGRAHNQELAKWYSWKLNSTLQDVLERRTAPYAYHGWDAAELAQMLNAPITQIDASLDQQDWARFDSNFSTLMQTCNACHRATDHDFIIVRSPGGERAPENQIFANGES